MRARRFIPALVLLIAGAVVLVAGGGSVTGDAAAILLLGIGAVLAVAGVFYEIGASEDRDRRAGRG